MATITKPPILDETGQDIVTKLNNINTQVTALNALIADLGLVSITPISQADYDNLSPTDKLNGVFDIYDAVEPNIDGNKVSYDSNNSVVEKIDEFQIIVGVTASSNGYSSNYNLPTGFNADNTIICGFQIEASTGEWRSGEGVGGSNFARTFAQITNSYLSVYNNNSGLFSKNFKVLVKKIA